MKKTSGHLYRQPEKRNQYPRIFRISVRMRFMRSAKVRCLQPSTSAMARSEILSFSFHIARMAFASGSISCKRLNQAVQQITISLNILHGGAIIRMMSISVTSSSSPWGMFKERFRRSGSHSTCTPCRTATTCCGAAAESLVLHFLRNAVCAHGHTLHKRREKRRTTVWFPCHRYDWPCSMGFPPCDLQICGNHRRSSYDFSQEPSNRSFSWQP